MEKTTVQRDIRSMMTSALLAALLVLAAPVDSRAQAPLCVAGAPTVAWRAEGETKTLMISTQPGCAWTVSASVPWIAFPNGANGTGPGGLVVTVAASDGRYRRGELNVNGRIGYVHQQKRFAPVTLHGPGTIGADWSNSGYSLATKGGVLAAGRVFADAAPRQAGEIVASRPGLSGGRILRPADGSPEDYFGKSVAIGDGFIVVGAPNANVGGQTQRGAAYIFAESQTGWVQQVKLVAPDAVAYRPLWCIRCGERNDRPRRRERSGAHL